MLVTFRTKAYSDITMFGDIAVGLLKLAGLSGNVPTAILAADIPGALDRLHAGLAEHGHTAPQPGGARASAEQAEPNDEQAEPPVPLGNRAQPLMQLLRAAQAAGADVLVQKSG